MAKVPVGTQLRIMGAFAKVSTAEEYHTFGQCTVSPVVGSNRHLRRGHARYHCT